MNAAVYKGIPVRIAPDVEQDFDFEVGENEEFGQFARITSQEPNTLFRKASTDPDISIWHCAGFCNN